MSAAGYAAVILAALLVDFAVRRSADLLNLVALPERPPEELAEAMSDEDVLRAGGYLRSRTRLGNVAAAIDLAAVLAFWAAGGFGVLDRWARATAGGWGLGAVGVGLLYLGVLLAGRGLLALPVRAWSTFVVEERFGFNRTTLGTFVADTLKVVALAAVLGGPVLAAVLWFFVHTGPGAWVYAWLAVTAATLGIQFLAPRVILPLFNEFEPVDDEELRAAVLATAEEAEFPVDDVQVMDGSKRSSKSNAFFVGLGSNRRIALFDTLVERHSVDEIVAVVAHEIGHWVRRHVPKRMAVAAVQTGVFFLLLSVVLGVDGLYAAFGVDRPSVHVGLVLFALLFAPVELLVSVPILAMSRRHEFEADRFAARITRRPAAMIAALRRLAADKLAHPAPHRAWVLVNASHPPVAARIRALREIDTGAGPSSRRRMAATLLTLTLLSLTAPACRPAPPRPGVVLVYVVDALRPDHLEPYGYARPTSPELREFRQSAVLYRDAYTTAPWTKPAVASLLTSRYPSGHRAQERNDRLPNTLWTAAELFSENGFETVAFSTNPNVSELFGFERGFDRLVPVGAPPGDRPKARVPRPVPAAEVVDAVREFLRQRAGDRPLFLYVHVMDTHSPYAPDPDDLRQVAPDHDGPEEVGWSDRFHVTVREAVNLYDAEIRSADRGFGELLDLLADQGLPDPAAIVFTSDHGEAFREHGELGHGKNLWQEIVRVPLLIRYPGRAGAGDTVEEPVSLVDLLPTVLEASGIQFGEAGLEPAGRSLVPGSHASPPEGGPRTLFMEEVRDEVELHALRRGPWKAILQLRPERRFHLFDVTRDPGEARNLASREPRTAKMLQAVLEDRADRGASGYWLVALAGPRSRRIAGRIRVEGEVVELARRGVEGGDRVDRTGEGIRFELGLAPAGGAGRYFGSMDPRKGFRFTTDPPGAALSVEIELDGRPLPRRLLRARARSGDGSGTSPFRIDSVGDLPDFDQGLPVRRSDGSHEVEVVLGYVPPSQRVEIDEATEEELRALGYQ